MIKRSFMIDISGYMSQNVMKESQILRPGGFTKVHIIKPLITEVNT